MHVVVWRANFLDIEDKVRSGHRKCIYIPADKKWVIDAIAQVIAEGEKLGVFISVSDVVVEAVEQYLEKYRKCNKFTRY